MAASPGQHDTAEFIPGVQFSDEFFERQPQPLAFEFGAASHRGHVRTNNEDHYAVVRRHRTSELVLTNLEPQGVTLADDSSFAIIVADGMGGARFGEFASRLALHRMFEVAQQATSWVMKFTSKEALQIRERVDAYVQAIQATMRDSIAADPQLSGMGTTWTSAHLMPPHALVVHIGDSRAYLLHSGELRQITHDETMAQAFIDTGLDPDSVKRFRHILLNSLGGERDKVTAQIHHVHLAAGDRLVLCTDGLTNMVADEEIAKILQQISAPQAACDQLIALALDNGGRDNITVIVAAASGPQA
jgi:serine/threonine protein phosphatase PrpC